ncbi:MAG: ATP-binding protein [Kiritimatiellia bacterium]|nr:ATP-binding protein [Kiritimatiellia bacterium]
MHKQDDILARGIRATEQTRRPAEGKLEADELVLARITEGIYRQPASALRELVSNAYDADATEVVILTDAPRFSQITVRDNGIGFSPEVLTHLVKHIGGSAKRSEIGKKLEVTSSRDVNCSPGGRQLIGKLGIGLFSVAQFTRHFLIITKTAGESFRTVADITLGIKEEHKSVPPLAAQPQRKFETGRFRIWREPAPDKKAQGTEIKLLELLPRTRDELASDDLWTRLDYQKEDQDAEKTEPPEVHIGRIQKGTGLISVPAALPWEITDGPDERFAKLAQKLRSLVTSDRESVDLRKVCDNYFWTLWSLALSAPVAYLEGHPFDLANDGEMLFFEIENRLKGQSDEIKVPRGKTLRKMFKLKAPDGATAGKFEVFMDGMQLLRPILYRDLPLTKDAVKKPLFFLGRHREEFKGKPPEQTGGPLAFEAYLFWSPKIIPKQHQGVILRVGNASGELFDPEFMGYETSEITRKSQVTAEIFVSEGLDEAINIDRESFNYANIHYQFLMKWLHSAFRQFSNRHKELGKQQRTTRLRSAATQVREKIDEKVQSALKARGIEDVPEVELLDPARKAEAAKLRQDGKIVLHKEVVIPPSTRIRHTEAERQKQQLAEKKAVAITQLLHGMGLLDSLSYVEQEQLVRDILEIVLLEN